VFFDSLKNIDNSLSCQVKNNEKKSKRKILSNTDSVYLPAFIRYCVGLLCLFVFAFLIMNGHLILLKETVDINYQETNKLITLA
jgi:hypothetical protein